MKTLFNFYLIYTYNCKSHLKRNLQLATWYMT